MWNIAFYILLIFSGSLDYAHKKFHRKASVSPVLNELKNSQQFTNKERERERESGRGERVLNQPVCKFIVVKVLPFQQDYIK